MRRLSNVSPVLVSMVLLLAIGPRAASGARLAHKVSGTVVVVPSGRTDEAMTAAMSIGSGSIVSPRARNGAVIGICSAGDCTTTRTSGGR